jgi:hypothetical protein
MTEVLIYFFGLWKDPSKLTPEAERLLEEYRAIRAVDSRRRQQLKVFPERIADTFDINVKLTTRPMGPDEKHGREFYFVTEELFDAFAAADAFSEKTNHDRERSESTFENRVGTNNKPAQFHFSDTLSSAGPYYGKLKADAVYDHTTYNAFKWGDVAHELMIPSGSCECEHIIGTPCYCYNPIPMPWKSHEWVANRLGGNLASVHSVKEQMCVLAMTNVWCAWIGARRESSGTGTRERADTTEGGKSGWKSDKGYDARFSVEIYTRGCHWFPRLLASTARFKRAGV